MFVIDTDRIGDDREYTEELRHRCITDHMFLAPLLGWPGFIPRIHQPAADLYVKKKPGLPLEDQDEIKNRLHLDPRGTGKTTMGMVDLIQWVCLNPDVTIMTETATQPLGKALTDTMASKFCRLKNAPWTPFHRIFPELVTDKIYFGVGYFCPARTFHAVEPTMFSTSVGTSQSGWHPHIIAADDMVETSNSGIDATTEVRQSVINTFYTNRNTLRFGGYMHIRGTRYHPFDLYGEILDKMDPAEWKVLVRSSLTVNDGSPILPGEFPDEENVTLHFPEMLSYRKLRSICLEDHSSFMCQQQNSPVGAANSVFNEELHGQALMQPERITPMGDVRICWRIASPAVPFAAKWDEGVAVRISNGHAYVIDAWRGVYSPSMRAEKIVAACKRHQAGQLMIEDMPGCRVNEAIILNEAHRRNISLRIEWLPFEDKHTRDSRIKMLEPQMKAGRLSISTAIGQPVEFKRQMVHFGLIEENGLIDCASRIAQLVPSSLLREEIEDVELELNRRRRDRAMSDMVFGAMAMEQRQREAREFAIANAPERRNPYGPHAPDLPGGLWG